jgi:hypothetical protein
MSGFDTRAVRGHREDALAAEAHVAPSFHKPLIPGERLHE